MCIRQSGSGELFGPPFMLPSYVNVNIDMIYQGLVLSLRPPTVWCSKTRWLVTGHLSVVTKYLLHVSLAKLVISVP